MFASTVIRAIRFRAECHRGTSLGDDQFGEYVTFVPNSPEAATAYRDTLGDLALGMLGGLIAAAITARLPALRPTDDHGSA